MAGISRRSGAPAGIQLADMAREVSAWLDLPGTAQFDGWRDAFGALFRAPGVVVVDEFPELAAGDPSIASIVQDLLGPRSRSATRLVLCGSAQRFRRDLLSGSAPLRGRAGLELVVRPFDLPTARGFWDVAAESR